MFSANNPWLIQESTIGPTPVVVDLVGSPAELARAVQQNHAATFVRATALEWVFCNGLRWSNQYDSLPTFVSNGPLINAWEQTWRTYVLGAERFVTGRSLLRANISISARPGGPPLAEVRIFNGRELYRRFIVKPQQQHFYRTLLLDGFVHRNLILQVRDAAGNTAVANSIRSWKPGSDAVIFCGDHTNGEFTTMRTAVPFG
jgi:hypothetical protein